MDNILIEVEDKFLNLEIDFLKFQETLKKIDKKSQIKLINNLLKKATTTYNTVAIKCLITNTYKNLLNTTIIFSFNYAMNSCNENIIKIFIEHKYGITEKPLLFLAIEEENLEIVKYLIEKYKTDINICDNNNDSALHRAIEQRNISIISYLTQRNNLNPLIKNSNHKTPVDLALEINNTQILKLIIKEYNKKHICFSILKRKNIALLKELINRKYYDVNYEDSTGNTLLHKAINDKITTQYLINLPQIQPLKKNFDNKTPIDLAREANNQKIYSLMIQNRYGNLKYSLLILATIHSDISLINHLLENSLIDVNDCDADGNSAIHHAASNNEIDILRILLALPNANPIQININMETPLDIAERKMHTECLNILIYTKYSKTVEGKLSLLELAIENQFFSLIKYLIEEKQIILSTIEKCRNLILASYQDNPEIIEYLAKGGHANYLTTQPLPLPLNIAAKQGFQKNCQIILQYFPESINLINIHNEYPALIEAIYENNEEVVNVLLEQNKIKINEHYALHIALQQKNKEIIKKLVMHPKVDIFFKNTQKKTALHIAIEEGLINNLEISQTLLNKHHSMQRKNLFHLVYILSFAMLFPLYIKILLYNSEVEKYNVVKNSIVTTLIIITLLLFLASTIFIISTKQEKQNLEKLIFIQNLNYQPAQIKKQDSINSRNTSSSSLENVSLYSPKNSLRKLSTDTFSSRRESTISESIKNLTTYYYNTIIQ